MLIKPPNLDVDDNVKNLSKKEQSKYYYKKMIKVRDYYFTSFMIWCITGFISTVLYKYHSGVWIILSVYCIMTALFDALLIHKFERVIRGLYNEFSKI